MLITRAASAKAIFTKVSLVLFLFAGVAAGQSNQSVYTSLEVKQCRTIKGSDAGDYEGRCRGAAGYALVLVEGDLRQNITVVTPKGAKHSLELWDVVSGGFSSVGPKAEWRMARQNGKLTPVALIIRYNANEDPEQPQKVNSYLAVTKITSAEICVTDKISPGPKANEEARRAADTAATKPCLKRR
jgi:hypothetical protein